MSPDVSAADLRSEAGQILPCAHSRTAVLCDPRHVVYASVVRDVNLQFIEVCVKTKGDADI